MQTNSAQSEIIQEFLNLSSWEERYKRIIELGKSLKAFDDKYKIDDLLVRGCQSQVWLRAYMGDDKKLYFEADSDAIIVKGLISILIRVYSGHTPDEILEMEPTFINELGLGQHLSPSRANGLRSMVKQIKYYALAFKAI